MTDATCPICASQTIDIGSIRSKFSQIDFHFCRCEQCGLAFIANPRLDFETIYDEGYYGGRGADPLVNYIAEMENPRSIRRYEWQGIARAVHTLTGSNDVKWLDFGCGLGGLVRYAKSAGYRNVCGFDEGWSAKWAARNGIPVLDRQSLALQKGTFDVITAIEVIEHVPDPVDLMTQVASLLRPGGVFFLTTGNAEPHRDSFTQWSYVHPDLHVSYFEPRTLAEVYRRAGLEPLDAGFLPGHSDIIRYKVLKTLHHRSKGALERMVPWPLASRIVDHRHRVTELPLARKPNPTSGGVTTPEGG